MHVPTVEGSERARRVGELKLGTLKEVRSEDRERDGEADRQDDEQAEPVEEVVGHLFEAHEEYAQPVIEREQLEETQEEGYGRHAKDRAERIDEHCELARVHRRAVQGWRSDVDHVQLARAITRGVRLAHRNMAQPADERDARMLVVRQVLQPIAKVTGEIRGAQSYSRRDQHECNEGHIEQIPHPIKPEAPIGVAARVVMLMDLLDHHRQQPSEEDAVRCVQRPA